MTTHLTLPRFWRHYGQLPPAVRELADKNYALLRSDPLHPSLHFKKVGRRRELWSVRVGEHYRESRKAPQFIDGDRRLRAEGTLFPVCV